MKRSKLTDSKPKVLLLSFVLAILLWIVVVLSVDRITTVTVENVKIPIQATGTSYQAMGLDLIDNGEDHYVNVVVSGDFTVVGSLTSDSFTITPDFSAVTEAGTYDIPVTATKKNQLLDFTIKSIEPSTVSMTFGESESVKVNVTGEVSGFEVEDGYVMQSVTCSPSSITIVGSSKDVSRIDRVVASTELTGTLSSSATCEADIVIYDAAGNVLPMDNFRVDYKTVELTVPIYKEGLLSLDVGFSNIPEGFDTSILSYSISPSEIRVASTAANIDNLNTKIIGYIDLADYELNKDYNFDISLSSGYVNLDNIETVTVKINAEGFSSRKMTVSDIRIENAPEGYQINILTSAINSVNVIGPEDKVDLLTSGSVVAIIDGSQIHTEQGSYNVPVSFVIPSSNSSWVAGSYTVVVEVIKE